MPVISSPFLPRLAAGLLCLAIAASSDSALLAQPSPLLERMERAGDAVVGVKAVAAQAFQTPSVQLARGPGGRIVVARQAAVGGFQRSGRT